MISPAAAADCRVEVCICVKELSQRLASIPWVRMHRLHEQLNIVRSKVVDALSNVAIGISDEDSLKKAIRSLEEVNCAVRKILDARTESRKEELEDATSSSECYEEERDKKRNRVALTEHAEV